MFVWNAMSPTVFMMFEMEWLDAWISFIAVVISAEERRNDSMPEVRSAMCAMPLSAKWRASLVSSLAERVFSAVRRVIEEICSVEAVVCSSEAACSDMLLATSPASTVMSDVTALSTSALELRFLIESMMRRRMYFSATHA